MPNSKYMYMSEAPENEDINDLLTQLKDTNATIKGQVDNDFHLEKDNLEQFLINNAGKLIKRSVDLIESIRDNVEASGEHKDVSALAELVGATSSAIETLNKIVINDKRTETAVKIKEMDIKNKKELVNNSESGNNRLSREEVIKAILNNVEVINIPPAQIEEKSSP